MYNILKIISCLLAVACAVVCVFIFVYYGLTWGFICLLVGGIFAALMFLFKHLEKKEELKANPPSPVPDFITGGVKPDEAENKSDGAKIKPEKQNTYEKDDKKD